GAHDFDAHRERRLACRIARRPYLEERGCVAEGVAEAIGMALAAARRDAFDGAVAHARETRDRRAAWEVALTGPDRAARGGPEAELARRAGVVAERPAPDGRRVGSSGSVRAQRCDLASTCGAGARAEPQSGKRSCISHGGHVTRSGRIGA